MLFFAIAASAAAGYFAGKKRADYYDEDWDDDAGEDDGGVLSMSRGRAVREIIEAGIDMKNALMRMRRSIKAITKKSVMDDEAEDEEEE